MKKISVKKQTILPRIVNTKTPKIITVKKTKIIRQKPIIIPQKIEKPIKFQANRPKNIKRVTELIKSNRKVIRTGPRIKKDANYKKISELKNIGLNRVLVMIACGPSILENDFSVLNNIDSVDIMVINKPLASVWPPRFWAFCDQSQYVRNKEHFCSYNGTLINSSAVLARKNNQVIIIAKAQTGIIRNIHDGYVIGRSSVYANIQVALWMNYDKIFIFGVDMCAVNGKLHHYGINPDVEEKKRIERFKNEAANYSIMAEKLPEDIRNRIYFCSSYNEWPFVKKFNKLDHKVALSEILKHALT